MKLVMKGKREWRQKVAMKVSIIGNAGQLCLISEKPLAALIISIDRVHRSRATYDNSIAKMRTVL